MAQRLLDGVRAVETANVITGPFAGMLLSNLGADVIKVEAPGGGDPFRQWDSTKRAMSPSFAGYNQGKESIALDLKQHTGREIYRRLVRDADVVIENSRPGVMDKLGVGWEALREVNPSLVYCYISGMGSWGPERNRPTFDAVAQALSGLWSQFVDLNEPEPVGPALADQLTGLYAACAVLAGLEKARRTSCGVKVEVSMLASCLAFQGSNLSLLLSEGVVAGKRTRAETSQSYAFIASDGLPLTVHLSSRQKFWEGLCQAADRADLMNDSRFDTKLSRTSHYDDLHDLLQESFQQRPREWWLDRLREYDVPAAPILTLGEAIRHPQVQALGVIHPGDSESTDTVKAPIAIGHEYLGADAPAPQLSANADKILTGIGYSAEEIARLRAGGVVG